MTTETEPSEEAKGIDVALFMLNHPNIYSNNDVKHTLEITLRKKNDVL